MFCTRNFSTISFFTASLDSARKSAADSNYTTTDEDQLGRGKRAHVIYNRFESDEDDSGPPRKYVKSNVLFTCLHFFVFFLLLDFQRLYYNNRVHYRSVISIHHPNCPCF